MGARPSPRVSRVLPLQSQLPKAPNDRRALSSARRWGGIALVGGAAALLLASFGASGTSAPADPSPDAEAGIALDAGEPAEVQAAEEASEGEAEYATFPVPSFATLAPIPAERDFVARSVLKDDKLVLEGAAPRTLTLSPSLQKKLTELLKSYAVPYGAIVAIEPATGRVLAMAEHSADAPAMRGLPLKAVYPAASVFKIVTGAALLSAGIGPNMSVCYHGGFRRLDPKLLEDGPRDGRCASLARAMGHSTNVIFAKLAKRSLDAKALRVWAEKLGFNAPFPFAEPVDVSVARIPDSTFDMAKTAAGFGEVFLSPLHAAVLAATVGNKGVMVSPVLFEGEASHARQALDEPTAQALADMMELTVTEGTARPAFRERGRYVLGEAQAAGKTGSLSDKKPFRDFSWFVGWAPKESPRIAVAAVVVNGALWRVRAPYLAREAMRMYLEPRPPRRSASKGTGRRNVARR